MAKKTKPAPEFDVEIVKLLTADVVARLALVKVDVADPTEELLAFIPSGFLLSACRKALTFYALACHRVLTYVWPISEGDLATEEHQAAIKCFLPALQVFLDRIDTVLDAVEIEVNDGDSEEPEPQLPSGDVSGSDLDLALGPSLARVAPTCQRTYLAYSPGVVAAKWSSIYPRYVGCISCCANGKICVFPAPGRKCESCKSGCKIFAAVDEASEVTVHKANTDLKKKYLLPKIGEDSVKDAPARKSRRQKEPAPSPPSEHSSGESEACEEEEEDTGVPELDILPDILAQIEAKSQQLKREAERARDASVELLACFTSGTRKIDVIAGCVAFPALAETRTQEIREWEEDLMSKLRVSTE